MESPRAVPGLLRDLNERTVFDAIRDGSPISRAEISRRTGISTPTVSLALEALRGSGLVRETEQAPGRPHYGAVYFEPVAEAGLALGLDIGGRYLRAAVADLRGEVRARRDVETRGLDIAAVADACARLGRSLAADTGALENAVVGVPGVVRDDGRVSLAGDIPGLGEIDLRAELEDRLGVPVTLENDVNLAAVGEHRHGAARGVDDFAFLSVGTGLGAAVVLGGGLHRGRNGAAGELDAVRSGRADDVDPCAGSLLELAAGVMPATSDLRAVFAAARGGDPAARSVVEEAARRIALHILPIAATVDVPLVVLGGGIGSNGDLLLEPVRALLAEWLVFPPRVESSSLGETAVLSGALAIGVEDALERVFAGRRP
jgi:predicted NBD/HSP70 family sugar kinase